MKLTQYQLSRLIHRIDISTLDVHATAKSILVFLSDHVRDDNNYSCFMSHDYMIKKLGYDKRTLKKYMSELKGKGLLDVVIGGGDKANTYRIIADKIVTLSGVKLEGKSTNHNIIQDKLLSKVSELDDETYELYYGTKRGV
jgi:hypothetical protein